MQHLESVFQDIIDEGGEGIILRDPKAPYQPGRCPGYLKHKVAFCFSFLGSFNISYFLRNLEMQRLAL